jgi:hypothetical protein
MDLNKISHRSMGSSAHAIGQSKQLESVKSTHAKSLPIISEEPEEQFLAQA